MKHRFFVLLFVFSSLLPASQEIERIDSIVNDIASLRKNYETKLLDEKEKNIILEQEKKSAQRKIKNLENEIKRLHSLLKNRETKQKNKIIIKKKIEKVFVQPACTSENVFPELKLKKSKKSTLQHFKASAFRLKKSANIYAGMHTKEVVQRWDGHTSFTSNLKSQTRIKITGYFIDKKWTKATQEMWVDLTDVEQK
ncbi:MAG: hypothetical protein FAF04_00365 [Epsilonproteobacteria bacterium]|nr:hypothetical protein [Campylobacterota bacterium]